MKFTRDIYNQNLFLRIKFPQPILAIIEIALWLFSLAREGSFSQQFSVSCKVGEGFVPSRFASVMLKKLLIPYNFLRIAYTLKGAID